MTVQMLKVVNRWAKIFAERYNLEVQTCLDAVVLSDFAKKRKKKAFSDFNAVLHLTWKERKESASNREGQSTADEEVSPRPKEIEAAVLEEDTLERAQGEGDSALDDSEDDVGEEIGAPPKKKRQTKHHKLMAEMLMESSRRFKENHYTPEQVAAAKKELEAGDHLPKPKNYKAPDVQAVTAQGVYDSICEQVRF